MRTNTLTTRGKRGLVRKMKSIQHGLVQIMGVLACTMLLLLPVQTTGDARLPPGLSGLSKNSLEYRECGDERYHPDTQACCDEAVFNVSQCQCRCCDGRCYTPEETIPDKCTKTCGAQLYHPPTQLCCESQVINQRSDDDECCGAEVIGSRTHRCCGNQDKFPVERKKYGCCNHQTPYHIATMRCSRSTGEVKMRRKPRDPFTGQQLCEQNLPLWDASAPLPSVIATSTGPRNASHIHVRGLVEPCSVLFKERISKGRRQAVMRLIPYFIKGTHLPQACAASLHLEVIVDLPEGQHCASQDQLQDYLHGHFLDIFIPVRKVQCRPRSSQPVPSNPASSQSQASQSQANQSQASQSQASQSQASQSQASEIQSAESAHQHPVVRLQDKSRAAVFLSDHTSAILDNPPKRRV